MKNEVKIKDSPCVNCGQYAECFSRCNLWKDWFREVWPIVTGRRCGLTCPKCGGYVSRDTVMGGFAICPVCESEVEDRATD